MKLLDLRLSEIERDSNQPRTDFDLAGLADLAASIAEHGVLQPILVRPVGDKYTIVAGERRWRSSKMAGRETIPALVADQVSDDAGLLDEASVLVLALSENIQRESLTGLELAASLALLRDKFGIPPVDLAKRIGKSLSTISKLLALVEPENQADLHLCGASDSGAGVADTLVKFRSLPRPAQTALREYSSRTGGTFSENDINKVKAYLAAGNTVLESGVDAVLSCTLQELRGRARDFEVAKRDVPAAVATPPLPVPTPALTSAVAGGCGWSTGPVIDLVEIDASTFFENPECAATEETAVPANAPTVAAVGITRLDLAGVVLTGGQVKALLKLLGADRLRGKPRPSGRGQERDGAAVRFGASSAASAAARCTAG